MSARPPTPHAPAGLGGVVESLLDLGDWGYCLLRCFYLARTSPSYRQAAPLLGISPATVTKRINALHALLTREAGAPVVLVTPGGRGPELTPAGVYVMGILKDWF